MKSLLQLHGIVTVLNTPFREDGAVALDGLGRHVDYALNAGVAGFLVPAMASEVSTLSEPERTAIVERVLTHADGKVPVIGGASAADQSTRLSAARLLIALGCPGILVSIPYESADSYRANVHELAELGPQFLMLQDWDSAGDGLPLELIVKLFDEVPAFRCLKIETAQAGPKYSRVLDATDGLLHVSGGWAVTQMIEGLDRGVHAFMPTGLHFAYVKIHALYRQGAREAAFALFQRLSPILAFSNQHLDHSILFFKRLLHAQGIYPTEKVRAPKQGFDRFQGRIADELVAMAVKMERELGTP